MKTFIVAAVVALTVSAGTAMGSSWINGRAIKPHSIPANRLTRTAMVSLRGQMGSQGLQGAPGPSGPSGPQGVSGLLNLSQITIARGEVAAKPGEIGSVDAICPIGTKVTGGGYGTNNPAIQVTYSAPADFTLGGWDVTAFNSSHSLAIIDAYAICGG